MLQKIHGFEQTQEARKVESAIIQRKTGGDLFLAAMAAPVAKQAPAAPRL
ncbi:MAG: hypothetical protein KGL10_02975 [Alphaproteobacteria bacterium]|nr:hypothetical protein [Alphaproteobacteria bacterium]